jgi:peptidoglycan/xylan/chitin deacetylase (PgdA/CDA1 family)
MSGVLVISIDFELHWGVRERPLDGPYRANLAGVPQSVRRTLDLFREFEVRGTWATVGFLFAESRKQMLTYSPTVRRRYRATQLDPYQEATGEGEADDPFHFGASLVREIASTVGQEVATHTYSHFYCLEPGEDVDIAFQADLESARRIMRDTLGREPRSIVFPRNRHNPRFDGILRSAGIDCYRGNPSAWMWRPPRSVAQNRLARAARLLDAYVPVAGDHSFAWEDVPQQNGMFNVPASFLVRPLSSGLRGWRIRRAIRHAARKGRIIHLWWHPHNFGVRTEENMAALRAILRTFDDCRRRYGMESLTMSEVAARCAGRPP